MFIVTSAAVIFFEFSKCSLVISDRIGILNPPSRTCSWKNDRSLSVRMESRRVARKLLLMTSSSGFRCSSISCIVLMQYVHLWKTPLQKIAYAACGCVFEYSVSFIISCVQLLIFSRTYADLKSSLPITAPKWGFYSQVILIPVSLKRFCAWSRLFGFLTMSQLFDLLT